MALHRRAFPQLRPWAVWFALCIALVMALAPTVSHALAWLQGGATDYVEVCTTGGTTLLAVTATPDSADSPNGQESAPTLNHCPFCLHATDRVALLTLPLPCPFLVQDGQRETLVWQAFFYPTSHAVSPPPRGPPVSNLLLNL